MNKSSLYFLIILVAFMYYGCDLPAPTELTLDDENQIQVEVTATNPEDQVYANGFDSTGVTENLTLYNNIISVSGIKVTKANTTMRSSFAQSIFYDKTKPILSSNGKPMAYMTRTPGIIKFNGETARQVPYRIKYGSAGAMEDTLIGFRYVLHNSSRSSVNDNFNYNYGSKINFQYIPNMGKGTPIKFDIPTVPEITGNIRLVGTKGSKNFRVILEWNRSIMRKIEIVIGAVTKDGRAVVPLFNVKVRDNGKTELPPNLLTNIPRGRFEKIQISFIRKIKIHHNNTHNELNIFSQSIHNIIIDIP